LIVFPLSLFFSLALDGDLPHLFIVGELAHRV
jgi:hypothetical protein